MSNIYRYKDIHLRGPGLVSGPTAEQLVKDIPELGVEGGVDDGVDGAVDVAQPRHHGDERGADVARLAQHIGDVHHEERRPAGQEHTCGAGRRGRAGPRRRG